MPELAAQQEQAAAPIILPAPLAVPVVQAVQVA
jgi:hypothetical protein